MSTALQHQPRPESLMPGDVKWSITRDQVDLVKGRESYPHRLVAINAFHPELVEHVAVFAAEHGDMDLEQLCDDALVGLTDEQLVIAQARNNDELAEWCTRRMRRRAP